MQYLIVGIILTLPLILPACGQRDTEMDKLLQQNRQLSEAVNTYQEQLRSVNTVRLLERAVKEQPTAEGGKVTTTVEQEHTSTEEVATLRSKLQRTEEQRDEIKERFKEVSKWAPPEAGINLLTGLIGAATGGGGILAIALPFIARLLGQRGRLIDAVQAVKNTLAGSDEDRRATANAAAQQHLNDTDVAVVEAHKAKRRAGKHPQFTSVAPAPTRTERNQV